MRRRSTVNVNDDRNLAIGGRVRRQQQTAVKRGAVIRFEFQIFFRAQSILRDFIARLPDRRTRAAANGTQRHLQGGHRAPEHALIVFAIVGEIAGINTLIMGELLCPAPIQLDGKDLALPRVALSRIKKHCACGFIDAFNSQHFEVAFGELPLQLGVGGHGIFFIEAVVVEMHVAVAPTRP